MKYHGNIKQIEKATENANKAQKAKGTSTNKPRAKKAGGKGSAKGNATKA